jgi:hypothetical protein
MPPLPAPATWVGSALRARRTDIAHTVLPPSISNRVRDHAPKYPLILRRSRARASVLPPPICHRSSRPCTFRASPPAHAARPNHDQTHQRSAGFTPLQCPPTRTSPANTATQANQFPAILHPRPLFEPSDPARFSPKSAKKLCVCLLPCMAACPTCLILATWKHMRFYRYFRGLDGGCPTPSGMMGACGRTASLTCQSTEAPCIQPSLRGTEIRGVVACGIPRVKTS